ncbi:MAG: DNA primase, partial [Calditrichia bacterium]
MAKVPEHLIDRIRESHDIVEVISQYLNLKKTGRNYQALCPFHTEKTPSFSVNPEKQIFHCFGCGEGGNVFTFLMKYEKISFIDALKKLAEPAGISLPSYQQDERITTEYDRLYQANQFAADFFADLAQKHAAFLKNYFNGRGITEKSIDFFKIGYVPEAWDLLYKAVQKKKLPLQPFLKTGLLLQSDKNPDRKYDRFRNRLIFPISNVAGRIIAFGGRILTEDPQAPKYLNSPESAIYKKSEILYGLNYSKDWIRKEDYVIFVEGYMDFIQLFQNGIKNIVATSGTALTEEHAK